MDTVVALCRGLVEQAARTQLADVAAINSRRVIEDEVCLFEEDISTLYRSLGQDTQAYLGNASMARGLNPLRRTLPMGLQSELQPARGFARTALPNVRPRTVERAKKVFLGYTI